MDTQKYLWVDIPIVDCVGQLEKMWYNSVGSLFKDVYLNIRF